MTTLVFNSLAYFEKLRSAGVDEEQAKVHAEAMSELIDTQLATKKDLELLKKDLVIKLGGMIMGSISLLYILLRFGH